MKWIDGIRAWLWFLQRQQDLLILWPECKKQAPSLDLAKVVFATHAFHDEAWVGHYGQEGLYAYINEMV